MRPSPLYHLPVPKISDSFLTISEARRLALSAQGFGVPSSRPPARAALTRLASKLGAIQIDSVNVLVRAHYLPFFSRLGSYRLPHLDQITYEKKELFEYLGHAASLLPVSLYPLFRHKMNNHSDPAKMHPRAAAWVKANHAYVEAAYREVADRGPLSAGELKDPGTSRGSWWGWSRGKVAMEMLFRAGRVSVAGRRNFERLYDLTERVLPPEIVSAPEIPEDEQRRQLITTAARALGVATTYDLADYFHLNHADTRRRVRELQDEGLLVEVAVEGWKDRAYMPSGARFGRPALDGALVSPFDSLVWNRRRTERLFGFHYRIEIYTPAPKRNYGYYVLPFLMGEELVGRLDLKADRKSATLLVNAAHTEPGVPVGEAAGAIAPQLRKMGEWLGLDGVRVARRGNAAKQLSQEMGKPPLPAIDRS